MAGRGGLRPPGDGPRGLIRQALLLAQHHSSDAFRRLSHFVRLDRFRTLDELAAALFGV